MSRNTLRQSLEGGKSLPQVVSKYDRYFEGYTEYREKRSDGKKGKIVRVYVADYYKRDLDTWKRYSIKLAYVFALFAAVGSFLMGSLMWFESRSVWPVAVMDAAAVACLALFGISVGNNLIAGEKMTIYIYKISSKSLIWRAALVSAVLLLGAVTILFSVLVQKGNLAEGALPSALCYVIGACSAFGVFALEKRMPYIRVPSGNAVPEYAREVEKGETQEDATI